ncbi:MAG TPA: hypothetical protein PLW14_10785 [Chlorobiota bacterium]|nr:hypothetical protein [Chlorobiota bacterium]
MISGNRRVGVSSGNNASTVCSLRHLCANCMLVLAALLLIPVSSHSQERQIIQTLMTTYDFLASRTDSSFVLAPAFSFGQLMVYNVESDGSVTQSLIDWKKQAGIASQTTYAFFHALIDKTTVLVSVVNEENDIELKVIGNGYSELIDGNTNHRAVSGDGRYVFYTRENPDNTSSVVRYDRQLKTKQDIKVLAQNIRSLQASRTGDRVLVAQTDKKHIVLNGSNGSVVSEFFRNDSVEYSSKLLLAPDGDIILGLGVYRNASANQLRWVAHYYEAATGNLVDTSHISEVRSVVFGQDFFLSPDGSTIVVTCDQDSVALYNLQSRETIIVDPKSRLVDAVGLCADNRTVFLSEIINLVQFVSYCRPAETPGPVVTTFIGFANSSGFPRLDNAAQNVLLTSSSGVRIDLDTLSKVVTSRWDGMNVTHTYGNDVLTVTSSDSVYTVTSVDLTTLDRNFVVSVPRMYGRLASTSRNNTRVAFYHNASQQIHIIDCSTGLVIQSIQVAPTGTTRDFLEFIQMDESGEYVLASGIAHGGLFRVSTGNSVGLNPVFTFPRPGTSYWMSPDARYFVGDNLDEYSRLLYDRERDSTTVILPDVDDAFVLATFTRDGENLIVVSEFCRVWRLRLPDLTVADEFQYFSPITPNRVILDYDAQSNTYAMSLDNGTRLEIIRRGVVNSTADEVVTPQTTSFAVSTSDDELTFALADVVDVRMSTLTGQDVSANARLTADAVMLPLHGTPRGTYVVRAATSTGKIYTVLLQKN